MRRVGGSITGLVMITIAGLAATPVAARAQDPEVRAQPTFTPYTVKPALKNQTEVKEQMTALYPPLLRDAGIGGTAIYWLFIDRHGEVLETRLFRSSGYDELDAAAARVASAMEWAPARNREAAADVWVQIPVTFVADPDAAPPSRETRRVAPRERAALPAQARRQTRAQIMAAPSFTPYTVKPKLLNGAETARALQRSYPPELRDAGIGGTAVLWFLIDEDGIPVTTRVARPSGYAAIDEAALAVAEQMDFSPALNRSEPVLVWVQIPVTFSSK